MTMHRILPLLALGVMAAVPAGTARAQSADIEAVAEMRGITLPAGYHERVRRDPAFFEFRHPRRVDLTGRRPGVPGGMLMGRTRLVSRSMKEMVSRWSNA